MNDLEEMWPDADRRDAALQRISETISGRRERNGEYARPLGDPRRPSPDLTPRELRVVIAISHGLGRKGTADVLGISEETVKTRLRLASRRAGAKNTTHLVSICLREGWIT